MEGLLWALGIEKALTWVVGLESTSANPALVTVGVSKDIVLQKQQKVLFGFTYTKRYGELSPVWCSVLCLV